MVAEWTLGYVGAKRNYRFFLTFVFTTTLLDLMVFALCWARLLGPNSNGSAGLGTSIVREPAALALICYTFLAFWYLSHWIAHPLVYRSSS